MAKQDAKVKVDEPPEELQEIQRQIDELVPRIGVGDWAKRLMSVESTDAVEMLVKQCLALHDMALRGDHWWRDGKTGALRYEARPDYKAALEAIRNIAQITAVKRTPADLTKEGRRWAAMSPEERAREVLEDPVHGPLLRQLIRDEQEER